MKTSLISNLSISNAMRLTIAQAQGDLIEGQKEATTGKHADFGVALGIKTAQSVDLNRDVLRIDSLVSTNSIVTQRLGASQEALKLMADAAQQVLKDLTALSGSENANTLSVIVTSVKGQFQTFTSAANTSADGEYLLAGINTDVQPLNDYFAAGSAAKTAYDNALSTFMAAQAPPVASVSQFSAAQMTDFITNTLEPMFSGPAWKTDWSKATDENMVSRISKSEVVETSTNTNSTGIRYFALASVVSSELLSANLASDVRKVVSAQAIQYTGKAIATLDEQRGKLGISEARVKSANESLGAQKLIIERHLSDLEGVDAYDASMRVKNLMALLDASYTLTSKIQQLSLVNFL